MAGPLAGFRIIDMTTVIMGPMASMMLSEMGADVIKIESPVGDQTRNYAQGRSPGMGAIFMNLNRNKRSIVLDLKQEAGRDALLRLVESADVLLYSLRPQAMQRLRLGYEECRAVNPKLIYCGAFGFRQDGPYAARPAYDDIIQGLCGAASNLAWITGEPRLLPAMNCDKTTGLYVVQAVTAALLHRERTGEGQAVEVSDEVVDRLVLEGGRGGASGLGPITEEREAVGEGQRLDADEDLPGNAEGTAAGHEDPQLAEERQPALEPCAEGDGAPVRLIEDQHSGAAGQAVGDRRGEGG